VTVVSQAFAEARPGLHAFGAAQFVERWLDPTGAAPQPALEGGWETLLLTRTPALELLLTASLPLAQDAPRFGVFSERSWLQAHPTISQRGAAMALTLLRIQIPPEPGSVELVAPQPPLTERAALESAVAPQPCRACHQFFDPLGYSLGHFDAVGDYRELDHEMPIDASGTYALEDGAVEYDGIRQLGQQLLATCDATLGLVDGFLIAAFDINRVPEDQRAELFGASSPRMRQAFVHSERRSYEDLVRSYAQSPAVLAQQ